MNCNNSNKITMYQGVDAVLVLHQETINSLAPFADAVGRYRSVLADILKNDSNIVGTSTGITAAKRNATRDLVEKAMLCVDALRVLSVKTGNEPLKAEVRITRSKLVISRSSVLLQICNKIIGLAQEYASELATYGIDVEGIGAVNSAVALLEKTIDEQTCKNAERKNAYNRQSEAFDTINVLLREELDKFVELVKTKDQNFYSHYKAVRKIKDLGGGHRAKTTAPAEEIKPRLDPAMSIAA